MLQTILAATDFSAGATQAVRRAALLAASHRAALRVMHVVHVAHPEHQPDDAGPTTPARASHARRQPPDELRVVQARVALRRLAADLSARYGVTASVEVCTGDTLTALVRAAALVDLLVLGRRGHGSQGGGGGQGSRARLKARLVGRTADQLIRVCRRPVLVVKRDAEGAYKRVLMAVNFSAGADIAVQFAAGVARGAHMHLFHAIDAGREAVPRRVGVAEGLITRLRALQEADVRARLRTRAVSLGLDAGQASFAAVRGAAAQATLEHAQALGADLVVAGKQGGTTIADFLLGSVSSRLLSGSDCDMLVVPRPRGERPTPPPPRLRRPDAPSVAPA